MSDYNAQYVWNQITPQWVDHIREAPGDEGDIVRKHMLNPVLFALLGDIKGRRLVDIGCGEGYLCRMMAQRGAEVTGLDVSDAMLEHARQQERSHPLSITYECASIETPPSSLSASFDLGVSNLVFNVLPDHHAAFRSSFELLKPGGILVVSIVHPAFDDVGAGWVASADGEMRFSVNRYFERVRGRAASGSASFHRCLSDYITTAIETGSVLTAFKEPVITGELARSLSADRQAFARVPFVAAMRFRKLEE